MAYLSLIKSFEDAKLILPPINAREIVKYDSHFQLLQQWNERINLVSRKSISTAFSFHYADCIHIADVMSEYRGHYFDLGTGAGFPGLIAAIRLTGCPFTLYEKSEKKLNFLRSAIDRLDLSNVTLETGIPPKLPRGFVCARAVFQREELFRRMDSTLAPGSFLLVTSGGNNSLSSVGKRFTKISEKKYLLPGDAGSRRAEIFECST
jgi:16S rRNA (guanine527-N7)-methyltransferase